MNDKAGPATGAPTPSGRGPDSAAAAGLECPKCHGVMRTYARGGLIVELCEQCRGIFLDKGELERLIEAEGGGWSGIVSVALDTKR